ncbi:MAG: HAD family hydrolase [Actinobacteria bacterium]|nr:HAD family hydrolase [Actinomycetota bacterium]
MARIDLVVTDLDGTLWDAQERIHDSTLVALREIEARGTPILVATGRRPRSARAGLSRANLQPPAVVLGGALGLDLASGEEFHRHAFERAEAMRVLEVFLDHDLEPVIYVEDGDTELVVGPHCATHPEHLRRVSGGVIREDPRRTVKERAVLNMGLIGGDPEVLGPVARDIEDGVAVINRDLFYGGVTLMVAPRGITKREGVLAFCDRAAVDPDRILAVGDGNNDVELLHQARIACVVQDGQEDALAVADHVIAPTAEGGWAEVLRFL